MCKTSVYFSRELTLSCAHLWLMYMIAWPDVQALIKPCNLCRLLVAVCHLSHAHNTDIIIWENVSACIFFKRKWIKKQLHISLCIIFVYRTLALTVVAIANLVCIQFFLCKPSKRTTCLCCFVFFFFPFNSILRKKSELSVEIGYATQRAYSDSLRAK